MLVLGIDPGTAITGYGLIQYERGQKRLIDYGTIRTAAALPMPLRLLAIHQDMNHLLDKFQPQVVVIEELFHHKNAKTVISVAQSRGVIMMTAAVRGMEIAEYTPLQVKQAVTGYGNADKNQVQTMVQKILNQDKKIKPDDAADALAIAICHIHSYRMQGIIQKGGNCL